MKFELFDKECVLQPIELILATLYIGFIMAVLVCSIITLEVYLPWWTETIEVSHGLLCIFAVWSLTRKY